MQSSKIPAIVWVPAICMALICGSLAWLALTERQLATATRVGIHYSDGLAAVVRGFLFLGAGLSFVGVLAIASRFRRLIWLSLGLVWVCGVAVFFLFFY